MYRCAAQQRLSWIIWMQSGRDGRNMFENTLQIVHVVLVQYRNSSLSRPEPMIVFEKQRLNSDFKIVLCPHKDQVFYLILNIINLPKATELEQTPIAASESWIWSFLFCAFYSCDNLSINHILERFSYFLLLPIRSCKMQMSPASGLLNISRAPPLNPLWSHQPFEKRTARMRQTLTDKAEFFGLLPFLLWPALCFRYKANVEMTLWEWWNCSTETKTIWIHPKAAHSPAPLFINGSKRAACLVLTTCLSARAEVILHVSLSF